MASGKRERIVTKRTVVIDDVSEEIVLRLTPDEAETLRFIGHRIGGSPKGRRGDMDSINTALTEAGVLEVALNQSTDVNDSIQRGSIFFNEARTKRTLA